VPPHRVQQHQSDPRAATTTGYGGDGSGDVATYGLQQPQPPPPPRGGIVFGGFGDGVGGPHGGGAGRGTSGGADCSPTVYPIVYPPATAAVGWLGEEWAAAEDEDDGLVVMLQARIGNLQGQLARFVGGRGAPV
jgi:hypothetical protein